MMEVHGLTLAYGVNRVVRDVSFSVQQGEVFAILGANGSGKTSILRAVSGLMAPLSGDIRFDGQSVIGQTPDAIVRRGISQVPEGRRVFPEMSVLDNLLVGATVHINDRNRVRRLLERNFELFPILRERVQQAAGTFSGGEQQQLTIARGLMADPRLLLVDEPTLGLAPAVIQSVVEVVRRMSALGLTIVVAEQNADFALKVAKGGIVLSSGEIRFEGDVETLRRTEEVRRAYLGA